MNKEAKTFFIVKAFTLIITITLASNANAQYAIDVEVQVKFKNIVLTAKDMVKNIAQHAVDTEYEIVDSAMEVDL